MNVDFAYYTQEELVTLINMATKFLDKDNQEKTLLYVRGVNAEPSGWWDASK
jgi:hypothetical protein